MPSLLILFSKPCKMYYVASIGWRHLCMFVIVYAVVVALSYNVQITISDARY
jgi:hypothetical protein